MIVEMVQSEYELKWRTVAEEGKPIMTKLRYLTVRYLIATQYPMISEMVPRLLLHLVRCHLSRQKCFADIAGRANRHLRVEVYVAAVAMAGSPLAQLPRITEIVKM
jgi:hypothetical protein